MMKTSKQRKDIHVPDTLMPGMDDIKDESYLPTMLFLVGLSIGIVLGFAIYFALTKVGRI